MQTDIDKNYRQIKADVGNIVKSEMKVRIKNKDYKDIK